MKAKKRKGKRRKQIKTKLKPNKKERGKMYKTDQFRFISALCNLF